MKNSQLIELFHQHDQTAAQRRMQALAITQQPRAADGLTDGERAVLEALKLAGYALVTGERWPRQIVKAA